MSEPCIHEGDFGVLFTKVDMMTESFKIMQTSNEALKIAIDAALKYQWSMEAIDRNHKERKEWTWKKTVFYSTTVLSITWLIIQLIKIKFG